MFAQHPFNKVLIKLFQKFLRSSRTGLSLVATSEILLRAFLFVSFFFAPIWIKEKADKRLRCRLKKMHYVCKGIPLSAESGWEVPDPQHRKEFRSLRRAAQGSALRTRKFFEKNLTKNLINGCSANTPINPHNKGSEISSLPFFLYYFSQIANANAE